MSNRCSADTELFMQLHVHSKSSHDSSEKIEDYVSYLHDLTITLGYDCAVLGITDHNVVPITMEQALQYSTERVLVIPGIQWRLHQSWSERLRCRSTRREMLTLGDHDDLIGFIKDSTGYPIASSGEILGHLKESELLDYLEGNSSIAVVVPHPSHGFVDYYGTAQIAVFKNEMDSRGIDLPFFVEVKTGSDPFFRILTSYERDYCVLGGSDAHEISGPFGTQSMLSVVTTFPAASSFLDRWKKIVEDRTLGEFRQFVMDFLVSLKRDNDRIWIKKHYGRAIAQLLRTVLPWMRRRLHDFPRNLLK